VRRIQDIREHRVPNTWVGGAIPDKIRHSGAVERMRRFRVSLESVLLAPMFETKSRIMPNAPKEI
jgi:hypothetical protein